MQPQTRYTDIGERLVACVLFQAPLPQKNSLRILVGRQPPGFVASAFVAAGVVDTTTEVGSGLSDGLESLPPLAGCQCWCSTPTEEKRTSAEQQRCGKCAAAHTSTTVTNIFQKDILRGQQTNSHKATHFYMTYVTQSSIHIMFNVQYASLLSVMLWNSCGTPCKRHSPSANSSADRKTKIHMLLAFLWYRLLILWLIQLCSVQKLTVESFTTVKGSKHKDLALALLVYNVNLAGALTHVHCFRNLACSANAQQCQLCTEQHGSACISEACPLRICQIISLRC